MRDLLILLVVAGMVLAAGETHAQWRKFAFSPSMPALQGKVRPGTFFDVSGRKSAIFGQEDGRFEAWIFPFQIVENFSLQYRFDGMAMPDDLSHYAESIDVLPERTTITYSHPLFTIRQHLFAPIDEPAICMLLEIDTYQAFDLYASFFPRLQPMWPGGMGGQYATWQADKNAYLISESRRQVNAMIGSPDARKQSPPLAHELSQKPILFALKIEPQQAQKQFYPIVMTADFSSREACAARYAALLASLQEQYRRTQIYWRDFLQSTVRLTGTEFDQVLDWNKVAMHKGFICNPDLGCGMIAGFGKSGASKRPGFGWYFGGDMFTNSLAMTAYGDLEIVKKSIAFLQKYQRADGKMMHELSQSAGLLDWFGDFPYGYIHGDTTPFYLAALQKYIQHSNDAAFVRESWDSIAKAYEWCRATDSDGDGLMENTLAGLGASELGSLREATGVDIFLAAIGVQAWKAYAELARVAGKNKKLQEDAMQWHTRGKASLEQKFWNADTGNYNFSLAKNGAPNPELTAWIAFPMLFDLLPAEHARLALREIASSKISTDWGSRMLSSDSPAYDPLAYNNGGVWPFLTGFTTWALYKQSNAEAGLQMLRNLATWTHEDALGVMPEIVSGAYFRPLETSVPHQLFSNFGFVASLLRGMLGLEVDAATRTLILAPQVPPDWPRFRIENIDVGGEKVSLELSPATNGMGLNLLNKPDAPITIDFRPAFGPFAELDSARTTPGLSAHLQNDGRTTHTRLTFSTAEHEQVMVAVDDPLRIWLPYQRPQIGDPPQQMKLIDLHKVDDRTVAVTVEAPAGSIRKLNYRADREIAVENARLKDGTTIEISFDGDEGYVRKEIKVQLK